MIKSTVHHTQRGMTIVEALVAVAVLAVVALILGAMFVTYVRTFGVYTKRAELVAEASRAMQRFSEYGVAATRIVDTRIINSVTYTTTADTIIFELPAVDAAQNILPATFDYVVFTQAATKDGRLLEIIDADANSARKSIARLLVNEVAAHRFVFQNADPASSGWVQFVLSLSATASSTHITHMSQTYATLRNF